MKELDVMLGQFLERQEAVLAAGGWPELEALLEAEDDRLWEWLRNPAASGAGPYLNLLENIRNGAN
jgi:succinate dehydrogenase flavin-adding protein (antitoxin of CptAB toxin-antitoxin module)